jgi:TRAP-type C4-dicarboxylate transport system permease small subunit
MTYFLRLLKRVNLGFVFISGVALVVMMAITVANVTGRKFFNRPLLAGVELAELCGVVFVSFALSYTQTRKDHVIMSIFIGKLQQRVRAVFDSFALIVSLATDIVLTWAGVLLVQEMVSKEELSPILCLPIAPFRAVWVAGLIFLCVVLFIHLVEALGKVVKR